jgi:hypothetical protein
MNEPEKFQRPKQKTKCVKEGTKWIVKVRNDKGDVIMKRGCPNPLSYPRPYSKEDRLYEHRRLKKYYSKVNNETKNKIAVYDDEASKQLPPTERPKKRPREKKEPKTKEKTTKRRKLPPTIKSSPTFPEENTKNEEPIITYLPPRPPPKEKVDLWGTLPDDEELVDLILDLDESAPPKTENKADQNLTFNDYAAQLYLLDLAWEDEFDERIDQKLYDELYNEPIDLTKPTSSNIPTTTVIDSEEIEERPIVVENLCTPTSWLESNLFDVFFAKDNIPELSMKNVNRLKSDIFYVNILPGPFSKKNANAFEAALSNPPKIIIQILNVSRTHWVVIFWGVITDGSTQPVIQAAYMDSIGTKTYYNDAEKQFRDAISQITNASSTKLINISGSKQQHDGRNCAIWAYLNSIKVAKYLLQQKGNWDTPQIKEHIEEIKDKNVDFNSLRNEYNKLYAKQQLIRFRNQKYLVDGPVSLGRKAHLSILDKLINLKVASMNGSLTKEVAIKTAQEIVDEYKAEMSNAEFDRYQNLIKNVIFKKQ